MSESKRTFAAEAMPTVEANESGGLHQEKQQRMKLRACACVMGGEAYLFTWMTGPVGFDSLTNRSLCFSRRRETERKRSARERGVETTTDRR